MNCSRFVESLAKILISAAMEILSLLLTFVVCPVPWKVFDGKITSPGFNFDYETQLQESTDIYTSREPTGKVFAVYEISLPSLAKYSIKPGSVALV